MVWIGVKETTYLFPIHGVLFCFFPDTCISGGRESLTGPETFDGDDENNRVLNIIETKRNNDCYQ